MKYPLAINPHPQLLGSTGSSDDVLSEEDRLYMEKSPIRNLPYRPDGSKEITRAESLAIDTFEVGKVSSISANNFSAYVRNRGLAKSQSAHIKDFNSALAFLYLLESWSSLHVLYANDPLFKEFAKAQIVLYENMSTDDGGIEGAVQRLAHMVAQYAIDKLLSAIGIKSIVPNAIKQKAVESTTRGMVSPLKKYIDSAENAIDVVESALKSVLLNAIDYDDLSQPLKQAVGTKDKFNSTMRSLVDEVFEELWDYLQSEFDKIIAPVFATTLMKKV